MLRKIIKSLIPSRGEVFFDLFVEAAQNVHFSASFLVDIVNEENAYKATELMAKLRQQRQNAVDINKKIIVELNEQFITPIDRGDIFHLSGIMLKLTKRIIKINKKMQIYAIDSKVDDCLIRSAVTLQEITKSLCDLLIAFKDKDGDKLKLASQRATELDENVVEDLGDAIDQIKKADYDTLTTIKLKEVFKAVESAVDTSATLCDSVMRIYVKEI
ncbi:DUF47 domain-containing protein [Cysteiniphilum sp. 6C5]|uniref:DUF47 domain-containing protein n=1 Tax=unclassified Cysteiniphilum TaxID=2610889 RepID=UPI003F87EB67